MTIRLLVLVGPNACGKTRLGVELAHRLGSEIVSADSRQVYRGLDIGSGKDLEEYRRVDPPLAAHLIDVADPQEPYSVFDYQRDCYELLKAKADAEPFVRGVPLVMVGGTGLYVEAVLHGYRIADVAEDPILRRDLIGRSRDDLANELRAIDPELWERTDRSSKKRIVRGLEIVAHARRGPVRYSQPAPVDIEHLVFGIDVTRDELRRRIDARLDKRLEQGLIAEVQRLLDTGITRERLAQLGLEYREVTEFLLGAKGEREMIDDLRLRIRQLAKRQQTWFRGLPRRGIDVTWIDGADVERVLGHPWVERRGA